MTRDLRALKAAVPLPELVRETHDINRSGKVLCPVHDDHNPSCHIYPERFRCYACGARGDALDWLELVHNVGTVEAVKELERRAGEYVPPVAPKAAPKPRKASLRPLEPHVLRRHHQLAARLDRVPTAMEGRGFTLDDLQHLGFAASGDDAVFPVLSPDGLILALKKRWAIPRVKERYRYVTKGHGMPAWCSPGFLQQSRVLVVEGELNAMACWLAAPELGLMGVAGTGCDLHLEALRGRTVYVYADGDEPGQAARSRWALEALVSEARDVFLLDPWTVDACEFATLYGRTTLREWLL